MSGGVSSDLSSQHSNDSDSVKHKGSFLRFSKGGSPINNTSFLPATPPPLIPPSFNHSDSTTNQLPLTITSNGDTVGLVVEADVYPEYQPSSTVDESVKSNISVSSAITLSISPPSSVSCLSATTSGFLTPVDVMTSPENLTKEGSTTPTALSVDGDDEQDTEEDAHPKFVPRLFIPVPGPIPVPLEPVPMSNSPIRLPLHPPNISIIPGLSDPRRLYNSLDRNEQVPPVSYIRPNSGGISRYSESPPISPASTTLSTHLIPHYFPVSSSPIDLITMLSRLGSFIGMILGILTPRLKRGLRQFDEIGGPLEVPREILQARKLVTNIQQQAENTKIEFLRKIHKVSRK